MSTPISIWLHVRLSGARIDTTHAATILLEQIDTMGGSGLLRSAASFHIGVSDMDMGLAQRIIPACTLEIFPYEKRGELPTLCALQKWVKDQPPTYVFYSHLKCASRADDLCAAWRRCMTHHLVKRWSYCVALLQQVESVGCHWMTPEEHPGNVKGVYWGGNFWWARSEFLKTLPPLPDHAANKDLYYMAESWIGMGPRRPSVVDFHHEWPHPGCANLVCKEVWA